MENVKMGLTTQNLLEIYDLVFTNVHSNGFKCAEIKDLLFDSEYWFIAKPKNDWKESLMSYLEKIGYDKSNLKMNPKFT